MAKQEDKSRAREKEQEDKNVKEQRKHDGEKREFLKLQKKKKRRAWQAAEDEKKGELELAFGHCVGYVYFEKK